MAERDNEAGGEPELKRIRTDGAGSAGVSDGRLSLSLTELEQRLWEINYSSDNGVVLSLREPAAQQAASNNEGSEWRRPSPCSVAPVIPELSGCVLRTLRMSDRNLVTELLPPAMWSLSTLATLDISRNRLGALPSGISGLVALQELDVSRNRLKELPKELGVLKELVKLAAHANNLRPAKRSLPLAELGSLTKLRSVDLRFNPKLKAAGPLLAEFVPQAKALLAGPPPQTSTQKKQTAGDRDATQLRSQLEPLSTPMLRRRLAQTFGKPTDPEVTGREDVMTMLLECYAKAGPSGRVIKPLAGQRLSQPLLNELTHELRSIDWPATLRERKSVNAEGYVTLKQPPVSTGPEAPKATKAVKLAAAKMQAFQKLWDLAAQAITEVDADYARNYSAIAVTKGFVGSPHIDTYDVGPQYALSLGKFDGGVLMVESGPKEVSAVNTHGRLAKVDGRFPHWVDEWTGERFSIIWFRTTGEPAPQTVAVFRPSNGPGQDGAYLRDAETKSTEL